MLNLNQISTGNENNEYQLIPDGTVARGVLVFQGGEHSIPEFTQMPYFKKSQTSSAMWAPIELTIVGGQFDKRKVWSNIFVDGDARDNDGVSKARRIGLETLRRIVDSAYNLKASDMSNEAQAKRNIPGIDALNGLEVCFVIGVEEGTNGYADRNRVKAFITPDSKDYLPGGNMSQGGNPGMVASMPAPVQQAMNAQMPPSVTATAGVAPAWAQK